MKDRAKKIFIIAGEASGDIHAAELFQQIRRREPGVSAFGVGGPRLKQTGADVIVDASEISIVGFSAVLKGVFRLLKTIRFLKREINDRNPDVAILVDLPDFNLIMAKYLRLRGIPVIYYISPQVWAWRKGRIHKIKKRVDKMLVLFPFERDFYLNHGVDVEFVGHPLIEVTPERTTLRSVTETTEAPRIALLPGSRSSELLYHAPVLRELAVLLKARFPRADIRVPVAPTLSRERVASVFADAPMECSGESAANLLSWADAAAVASGTATLEAALAGVPFLIFYRMSGFNAFLIRKVFGYRGVAGMPNILLQRPAIREFIQEQVSASDLFGEMLLLIQNAAYRERVFQDLSNCRNCLGAPGASARAAQSVLKTLQIHKSTSHSEQGKGGVLESIPAPS